MPFLTTSLPALSGDLLLLHAPAFFDFRGRRDIYFPFLGTSGDVPITPLYDYFPVGFKTLQRFLSEAGYEIKLINLTTVLLRYPKVDFDALAAALDFKLIGLDLHWMVHVQGSLAVAERIKAILPHVPLIFGGISSTYYAEELIRYPFVDMVMRGYDTHAPMAALLGAIKGRGSLAAVPNLLWKSTGGQIRDNGVSHSPDGFACGIDWARNLPSAPTKTLPIREFLSTQNAGCAYNCGWCAGSRDSFRRIFKRQKAMARKPAAEISYEFETMNRLPNVEQAHFFSVGSYNESKAGFSFFLDRVAESRFKSVSYEQYFLTPDDVLRHMVQANKRTIIALSPESHELRVAKLAGRGVYTNDELEAWLEKALAYGIHGVDLWYIIGMPEQDEKSVMGTVEYCHRLLDRFKGTRVQPLICPMIPFLDPASAFFEQAHEHGYRIFHRSVEEHRRGMERASLINRINYETKWLTRRDLVHVGFRAVRALMEAKAEAGFLPHLWVQDYIAKIDDALSFIDLVHAVDCLRNEEDRKRELERLGDDILHRNEMIFFSGVMNQVFPVNRQIGGRWFDEMGWTAEELERAATVAPPPASA